MLDINGKAVGVLVFVMLTAMTGVALAFQKKTVRHDSAYGLTLPSLVGHLRSEPAELQRYTRTAGVLRASLLSTFFESPVMVFDDAPSSTIYCVYNFDVGYRVLVFRDPASPRTDDREIKIIVPKSDLSVHEATQDEYRYAMKRIDEMSDAEYKRHAFPAVDLGFARWFASKENLVQRVAEASQRQR
jgi:hypothetical protein